LPGFLLSDLKKYFNKHPKTAKRDYPIIKTRDNMNKKKTERIKVLIEKVRKTEFDKSFTMVILEYDSQSFFDKNHSISKWFQKLSNSKSTTGRISNREWFKNVDEGFYKYDIKMETTKITLIFTSTKPISELDLNVRIQKIGPKPKKLTISNQNWGLFTENFATLFDTTTGTETFGKLKTMDYYEVEIMQELIESENQLLNQL
jgi:hypothetical protein